MKKLWDKGIPANLQVEQFTTGEDRKLDLQLAAADILGSIAHVRMLGEVGLLSSDESRQLVTTLQQLYPLVTAPGFVLEEGVEDIHSQIELLLTRQLGETGKKVHSGRSRNDQVLIDLKLFFRSEIFSLTEALEPLFRQLIQLAEQHKDQLMPGYTHLQVAMPSSFGLWFGAWAESLSDDMESLLAAFRLVNKNPLGSAAGYGSSFPLNRQLTTDLLAFDSLHYNVINAQMSRGKTEIRVAEALAALGSTLARLAMDMCLYMGQNFGFIRFPDQLTTGSSIMPHKKNPDVWELIRAKGNRLQGLPNSLRLMTTNLPAGYHRDLQLLKEELFPAFTDLKACLEMSLLMLQNIEVQPDLLKDERYRYLFTVEVVNRKVLEGQNFRDAYREVGEAVSNGTFSFEDTLRHTHEGSLGKLMLAEITASFDSKLTAFSAAEIRQRERSLLGTV